MVEKSNEFIVFQGPMGYPFVIIGASSTELQQTGQSPESLER